MEDNRYSMYWNVGIKKNDFSRFGITVNHILTRYGSVKSMPYEWKILLELPGEAEEIYDMELAFKGQMEQFHYTPTIPFNGSKTECYFQLAENLKKLIKHTIQESNND